MDLTVSDIQEQLTRGKTQFNASVKELRAQLATAEKAGNPTKDLVQQIQNIGLVHHRSVAWLSQALLVAKYRENNQSVAEANGQKDAQEFAKNAALSTWLQAGGKPAEFEAMWPETRFAQIKEFVSQKQAETPARKPLSL